MLYRHDSSPFRDLCSGTLFTGTNLAIASQRDNESLGSIEPRNSEAQFSPCCDGLTNATCHMNLDRGELWIEPMIYPYSQQERANV